MNIKRILCLYFLLLSLALEGSVLSAESALKRYKEISGDEFTKEQISELLDEAKSQVSPEAQLLFNSIKNYNRTGSLDSLAIVEQELTDPVGKYREIIFSKLDIDEVSLPVYLKAAERENGDEEKVAIAIALREAPPTDAVIALLETLKADEVNVYAAELADYALKLHRGESIEDTLLHRLAEKSEKDANTAYFIKNPRTDAADIEAGNDKGTHVDSIEKAGTKNDQNHLVWWAIIASALGVLIFLLLRRRCRSL